MTSRRVAAPNSKRIPPPPGPDQGYEALIAYFNKYSTEQLERAGHLEEPSEDEEQELARSAAYWRVCREGLRLRLTPKEYERLAGVAARKQIAVEELVRKWIHQRLREESKGTIRENR